MEHSIRFLLLQPKLLVTIRNEQFRQHIDFVSVTITFGVIAIVVGNLVFQPPQVTGEVGAAVTVLVEVVGIGRIGQTLKDPCGDCDELRGFGGAPVVVKPEGAGDDLLGHLLLSVVEVVNVVGVVSLEGLQDCSFEFGECTNDAAHVGDYEGVDEALQLHGA
ncbi:hypothetical protein DEO72_LG9g201 [Vigna unguiculata]|uniref:Uncharacterized protein n=1 Tax=Vigna unguiculata TaxID=3917 RepID=A0A4D6MUP5_VIGUN|nr:hypothetical protein DEO72_LG9g201 [Vigna unguiculata]